MTGLECPAIWRLGYKRDPLRSFERQGGIVAGNGTAGREGIWCRYGNAAAHAGVGRRGMTRTQCAEPGWRDQSEAVFRARAELTSINILCRGA